eukprot:TRINITY_DN611_c0_g1_i1.p1 TRINITY_DN611_c0_g1~~TRINITY_DN611_c0_g1_i1.p1  ORF type:complete len:217 (-),score=38.87 TRINITY_DN611_c0_g1_i1:897-1547(-)
MGDNNDITQQPNAAFATKGLEMWINIMLNVESGLDLDTIKILTVVSRPIANTLKSYIQQNYWFDLSNGRKLTYYLPTNQKNIKDPKEIVPTARKIVFLPSFNDKVDGLIPNEITHIEFGTKFDQSVDDLPANLVSLEFAWNFNQPVNKLPPKVTHIYFGVDFKQLIGSLPPSVKQVFFIKGYDQPIDHLSKDIRFLVIVFEEGQLLVKDYPYTPKQ